MRSGNGTVLVVDDDKLSRAIISAIVTKLGYEVEQAEGGPKALQMASSTSYDCILLDLVMPEMDGFETLMQLKQEPGTMHIPVIVISGNEDLLSVTRSIDMGAIDYIPKPVDGTLLSARLKSSLTEKRFRDLEKQHLIELNRVRARLAAVINDSPMGIMLLALDGSVQEVNPTFMNMMRAETESVLLGPILKHCGGTDHSCYDEMREFMSSSGGSIFTREVVLRRIDGTTFDAGLTMSMVNSDGTSFVVAMVQDITERKKMEAALKESEAQIRDIFNSTNDGIFIHDMKGRFLEVNEIAHRKLGYTREDMLNMSLLQVDAPDEADKMVGRIEMLNQKGHMVYESAAMTKDGHRIPIEVSSRKIQFKGEEALLSVVRDITKRKKMEQSLEEANKKLGLLNAITRHDIINQTVILAGYIELMRKRHKEQDIISSLDRMKTTTDNITRQITFTKDYQEMGVKAAEWMSLGKVIHESYNALKPQGIEVEQDVGNYEILADHLLQKVFYNLIDNSMRHGEYVSKVNFSCKPHDGSLNLIYRDNGCGIREEYRERLFEKGFGKNTGLGLFLTKEILGITGITIEEKGSFGKGACFEMKVPEGAFRQGQ